MLLIDGDIVAWRTGTGKFNCKPGDMRFYYHSCSLFIHRIVTTFADPDIRIFLSGKQIPNFRSLIYPDYKANRKDLVKPQEVKELEWYLQDVLGAELIHGYEADDALGWNQTETTVICTIDKDLDMIPGMHYNFVSGKSYYVNQSTALKQSYDQKDDQKQLFIIRQSSLTNAVNTLAAGIDPDNVKVVAQNYIDFVFGNNIPTPVDSSDEEDYID